MNRVEQVLGIQPAVLVLCRMHEWQASNVQ